LIAAALLAAAAAIMTGLQDTAKTRQSLPPATSGHLRDQVAPQSALVSLSTDGCLPASADHLGGHGAPSAAPASTTSGRISGRRWGPSFLLNATC